MCSALCFKTPFGETAPWHRCENSPTAVGPYSSHAALHSHPGDIFSIVLESLRCADSRDMSDLIISMLADMQSIFSLNEQFFAVIDEAQVASEYMNESFRSLTIGIDARAVLDPFYRFLQGADFIKGTVLAGTSLLMKMVKKAVSSQSAQRKPKSFNLS